ncbi:MAG: hypothetical protein OYL97_23530 [Candidatus Poribacteria bacterium]|nr:hypothetical protein [Candidatus Poribacteria bacterium]
MESIIQMLAPLIIVILISLLSNSRRRKAQQRNMERQQQRNTEGQTDENAMPESDDALPPFMEDFPFVTELEQPVSQQDEAEVMPVAAVESTPPESEQPDPVVETPQPQPPPVPIDSPTGRRPIPGTSLLQLSPQTFRQGIILSEILGRPKGRTHRRSVVSRQ